MTACLYMPENRTLFPARFLKTPNFPLLFHHNHAFPFPFQIISFRQPSAASGKGSGGLDLLIFI